jgi:hypothetical protein
MDKEVAKLAGVSGSTVSSWRMERVQYNLLL